jgi:uncharacterized membrane protein
LIALAAFGLGDAAYLTVVHYARVTPICASTGLINCEKVVTSQFSVIPGTSIPITVPGMAFFLVALTLAIAQFIRPDSFNLRSLHFTLARLGLLAVFYLVFVEVVELKAICLWCTFVHLDILLMLLTTAWRLSPRDDQNIKQAA